MSADQDVITTQKREPLGPFLRRVKPRMTKFRRRCVDLLELPQTRRKEVVPNPKKHTDLPLLMRQLPHEAVILLVPVRRPHLVAGVITHALYRVHPHALLPRIRGIPPVLRPVVKRQRLMVGVPPLLVVAHPHIRTGAHHHPSWAVVPIVASRVHRPLLVPFVGEKPLNPSTFALPIFALLLRASPITDVFAQPRPESLLHRPMPAVVPLTFIVLRPPLPSVVEPLPPTSRKLSVPRPPWPSSV